MIENLVVGESGGWRIKWFAHIFLILETWETLETHETLETLERLETVKIM